MAKNGRGGEQYDCNSPPSVAVCDEWLMQKRLELESDGKHTYELLSERDIGDGLTVVFYQENN